MGHALRSLTLTRGATTFSKLGVQCLGVGYCTEQNADGIPSFMHCSLLRNGNHTLHQKVGVVRLNLGGGGPDPHRPPYGCALDSVTRFIPNTNSFIPLYVK